MEQQAKRGGERGPERLGGPPRSAGRPGSDGREEPTRLPAPPSLDVARRARAYREIRLWGDPALRAVARPVAEFGPDLGAEIAHQAQVLFDAPGTGLAAPQIGRLRRIVVYRLPEDGLEPFFRALVNPRIVAASPERELFEEGCLSMPGVYAEVERAAAVTVHAHDAAGAPLEIDAEGHHASVLQHELDHLDGVLITDRLARADRRRFLAELRPILAVRGAGREG